MIENYSAVANLCSTSKIFEKVILKRIRHLELLGGTDLTRKGQHGFKMKHSTASKSETLEACVKKSKKLIKKI